jgi:hypothetical protein
VAPEERIGDEIGVERCLELIGEIPVGNPRQDRSTFGRDSRITRTPAKPPLFRIVNINHGVYFASCSFTKKPSRRANR